MTHGALAEDTTTVGLTALRDRIHETTEALAQGIGRAPGLIRAPNPPNQGGSTEDRLDELT